MKKYNYLIYITTVILFTACNSDEIICNTNDSDVPTTSCDTGLLIMRSQLNPANQLDFTLDSIQKPVNMPLVFNTIRTDVQDNFFGVYTRPSNYDTYNSINDTYFIEFPVEQRLYKYNNTTQTRQEFIVAGFYSAPVFNNGDLYAITIDNFGYATNPANYSIDQINQNDGSLNTLTSNSFPLLSRFDWESMSSATDNNGIIYFLSGTNLIVYNTNTSIATHVELTPGFNISDNFQNFYGLELRDNGNLLAIRVRDDINGEGVELVEISVNNLNTTPIVVFDFMVNNIELNSEFYSTTYDTCDDTYYITSRKDATTTDFYEINLATATIQNESFDFYLMGIQTKNN